MRKPRLSRLRDRAASVPMAGAAIILAAGIAAGHQTVLPLWFEAAGFVMCCVMAYLCNRRAAGAAYVAAAVALFGMMLPSLHRRTTGIPYDRSIDMLVEIRSEPVVRDGYMTAEGRIRAWSLGSQGHEADDRVWLWIGCDSLAWGQTISLRGRLRERISRHEDFSEAMHRRGYVGSVSVGAGDISERRPAAGTSLQSRAVARIRSLGLSPSSGSVVEAMTTGSRAGIGGDLRGSYSRSGAAHLLAVSGLHLGIVAAVANFLLAWLSLLHGGHIVRNIAVTAVIWIFAAMSGMSPSAVRAAAMFSILQFALASSSLHVSINALSAAVFVMLSIDSSYLYDVGFRLSVLAVAGILLWGVPLYRRLRCGRRIADALTATMAAGISATLWTMPVISETFGYVAWGGVAINPPVMISSAVIVACGMAAIALPAGWLAAPLAAVLDGTAEVQNALVEWAGGWGTADWRMGRGAVFAAYALYAAITLLAWSADRKKRVTLPRHDDLIRH